jgi:hypothetical protein
VFSVENPIEGGLFNDQPQRLGDLILYGLRARSSHDSARRGAARRDEANRY